MGLQVVLFQDWELIFIHVANSKAQDPATRSGRIFLLYFGELGLWGFRFWREPLSGQRE